MSDINIGIKLELGPESEQVIQKLTDLSKMLQQIQVNFTNIAGAVSNIKVPSVEPIQVQPAVSVAKASSDVQRELNVQAKDIDRAIRAFSNRFAKELSIPFLLNIKRELISKQVYEELSEAIQPHLKELEESVGREKLPRFIQTLGLDVLEKKFPGLQQAMKTYSDMTRAVRFETSKINDSMALASARVGAVNKAFLDFSRTLYWSSLSMIFTFLSLSRLNRATLEVQRTELAVIRAHEAVSKAQDAVTELQQQGLEGTREYSYALLDLQEAQLNLKYANDMVRASVENQILGYIMLISTVFPGILRLGAGVFEFTLRLVSAYDIEKASLNDLIKTYMIKRGVELASIAPMEVINLTLLKTIALTGALTLGFTLLTFAISKFIAEREVASITEEINKKMKELGLTMNEEHSPSVVDTFLVMARNVRSFNREAGDLRDIKIKVDDSEIKKMDIETEDITKNIKVAVDVDVPKITVPPVKIEVEKPDLDIRIPAKVDIEKPDIELSAKLDLEKINVVVPVEFDISEIPSLVVPVKFDVEEPNIRFQEEPRGVVINVNGPFYVRSEQDIDAIVEEIRKISYLEFSRKGGYAF